MSSNCYVNDNSFDWETSFPMNQGRYGAHTVNVNGTGIILAAGGQSESENIQSLEYFIPGKIMWFWEVG